MNRRILIAAPLLALAIIAIISGAYITEFGFSRVSNRGAWGEFGDYFGGILNPLFALLAFLSALWSINVQQKEARAAAVELGNQTNIARRQFEAARNDRLDEELLYVIRDIDVRIDALLRTDITAPGTNQNVTITMMVAEAERLATRGGTSTSFDQFVQAAREPGTVVEALMREIRHLVLTLQSFLQQYSTNRATGAAPLIVYYAAKAYALLHMVEAVEALPLDTRGFFATVSDAHG